ncbi:hypothetical protein QBC38DRAFT_44931 [Podospora fimiseda]|uniref:Uncharacterized protein n=1 Tax=Podospora fimiseda TaxID=252190 RepID=A0AAN7GSM2_9PEZI|nr:hypothetical protein QBC38DRAFT_44931 [Podospora fimiseda]
MGYFPLEWNHGIHLNTSMSTSMRFKSGNPTAWTSDVQIQNGFERAKALSHLCPFLNVYFAFWFVRKEKILAYWDYSNGCFFLSRMTKYMFMDGGFLIVSAFILFSNSIH